MFSGLGVGYPLRGCPGFGEGGMERKQGSEVRSRSDRAFPTMCEQWHGYLVMQIVAPTGFQKSGV